MNRIEKKVLKIISKNFPAKNIRILELTPGEGNLTRALIEHGYNNIEALDINPQNFTVDGVRCHKGDLNKPFPFDSDAFDLVISVEGIEHLENQYQFAAELRRIVKGQGHVIITTPNIINFASRLRFLLSGFYSLAQRPNNEYEKNWVIEHIYPLTFWQLRHILHTNGLFIQKLETDHIRKSALIGAPLFPLTFFYTWKTFAKEPDQRQKRTNFEILKQIHKPGIYFGRTQVVLAEKRASSYIKAA